ncbi:MAG: hypothetical protein PHN42_05420 [Bacilli bacterium]|nr:hypothetical protein [Bacilli bacterium]
MKDLYIDFDGVILDTIKTIYSMLEKENIDSKNFEQTSIFLSTINWDEFIDDTPQINNSLDCIDKILKSNKYNVSILTHINSLDEAIAKVNFIRKRFNDITIIPVPKKISKTKMVHTKGAILIDDYSGNLREWEKEGGIGIRFSTKLNGKGFKVIDQLDKVLDLDI